MWLSMCNFAFAIPGAVCNLFIAGDAQAPARSATVTTCDGGIVPLCAGAILVYDHRLIIRASGIEPEQMRQAREKGGIVPPYHAESFEIRLRFLLH